MKLTLLSIATLTVLMSSLVAQTATLLKDINNRPYPTHSYANPIAAQKWTGQENFATLGKKTLFVATTPATGYELWTTDGTSVGTKILKDLYSGPGASSPRNLRLTNDGSRAFFACRGGGWGWEPWVTDGTTAGTTLIADIYVGGYNSNPQDLTPIGKGSVVFTAMTATTGRELFMSDGTTAGTKLLRDIRPGIYSSDPTHLRSTRDGKLVFFAANDGAQGVELWVTDGTTAGTRLVKDINPGGTSSHSDVGFLTPLGSSQILFEADDQVSGKELWISDGTSSGTKLLVDLDPGSADGATTEHAITLGNLVIFNGKTKTTGWEPYITDGTVKGTRLLVDASPGMGDGHMKFPHWDSTGTKVYWSSYTGLGGYRIFVSDGTTLGTKQMSSRDVGHHPRFLAEIQGKVYFDGRQLTLGTGNELGVCDGTPTGTKLLKDIYPGNGDGNPRFLTRIAGGKLLFQGHDGWHGEELWAFTPGGKFELIDVYRPKVVRTYPSSPTTAARFGKYLVFTANDGSTGHETYISDGTAAGTRLLRDMVPGPGGYANRSYAVAGDKLVFLAYTQPAGIELFVTDGTSAGTKLLKDILPGPGSVNIGSLRSIGGKVYFWAHGPGTGREPWISDGTTAGTHILKDINPGGGGSTVDGFAGHGNQVVFMAETPAHGYEIHITDGTTVGTRLLKDIQPGTKRSTPRLFTWCGGKVFFVAETDGYGKELWITDFTTAGTKMVKDINPGWNHSDPTYLHARNGRLFFTANPGFGRRLYVSDGTSFGTKVFYDFQQGSTIIQPSKITAVGSRKVYFTVNTSSSGEETVVSDGTAAGTHLIDINPGRSHGFGSFLSWPCARVALGNRVFMLGDTPEYGKEVYSVDNGATAEPVGSPYGSTWIHGSDPVMGQSATIEGATGLANAVHLTIMGALSDRPVRFGTHGYLHFDLMRYFYIPSVTQGKKIAMTYPIPNKPALKGLQVVFQTLAFDSSNINATLELSNGLHWALGN